MGRHTLKILQPMLRNFEPVFDYFVGTRRYKVKTFVQNLQKGESQSRCNKKTKHAKFSEKRTFLTP